MENWSDEFEIVIDSGSRWDDEPPGCVMAASLQDVDLTTEEVRRAVLGVVPPTQPYLMAEKRTECNWGADNAFTSVVFSFGEWMASGIAFDVLRTALVQLWRERSSAHGEPLAEAEAIARAQWIVESRYSIPLDELSVSSREQHGDDRWVIGLTSSGGGSFEVELLEADGAIYVVRTKAVGEPPSAEGG